MPKVNWVNVYSLIAARLLMSMEKPLCFLAIIILMTERLMSSCLMHVIFVSLLAGM